MPGYDGGGEWGGSTWDPETRLLYVNANEMPGSIRLIPTKDAAEKSTGRTRFPGRVMNSRIAEPIKGEMRSRP